MKLASRDANASKKLGDEAKELLVAAEKAVTLSIVKEQLDHELKQHERMASYCTEEAQRRAEVIGRPAAEFKVDDLKGKPHELKDFKGKVVIMDFWYRGCGWCMRAMPQVKELAEEFRDQPVAVLGMNTDRKEDDAKFVIDKMGLTYLTLKAEGLPEKYGVRGFPTLVIIDKQGKVQDLHVGYSPDLQKEVGRNRTEFTRQEVRTPDLSTARKVTLTSRRLHAGGLRAMRRCDEGLMRKPFCQQFSLAVSVAVSLLLSACDQTGTATVRKEAGARRRVKKQRRSPPPRQRHWLHPRSRPPPLQLRAETDRAGTASAESRVAGDRDECAQTRAQSAEANHSPSPSTCRSRPAGTFTPSTGRPVCQFRLRSSSSCRPAWNREANGKSPEPALDDSSARGAGVCLSRRGRVSANNSSETRHPGGSDGYSGGVPLPGLRPVFLPCPRDSQTPDVDSNRSIIKEVRCDCFGQ